MNSKITVILIIVVIVLGLGAGAWWYLESREDTKNLADVLSGDEEVAQTSPQENIEEENRVFATDDFSIRYPEGWRSVQAPVGVSAIIINQNEIISDPQAKKANFRSYLSISYDSYGQTTQDQYITTVKQQLLVALPGSEFLHENKTSVNGRDAYAFEIKGTQNGFDFHVLMVIVEGEGEDVWVLSFNTLESLWDGYLDTFADTTNTFVVKK